MAKWFGKIGFAVEVEKTPGVWVKDIVERNYYGEVSRNSRRLQSTDNLNDNITVGNEISIISDPFANGNFHHLLYVEFMGAKWTVSNVDVKYPRLILSLGGLYNG